MNQDTLRTIIVAALLPVVAIAIRLLANLVVRIFPGLRKYHEPPKDDHR